MIRLRQVALVVNDLAAARRDFAAIFGPVEGYEDPGVARYGLANIVYPLGGTFLEVLEPVQPDTTVGRLLDKRGGDSGYMVILQTDGIAAARNRVEQCGVRIVDQIDRDGAGFTHLHPRDTGGTLLSIDCMRNWDDWAWGGPDWQQHRTPGGELAIVAAEIQGSDPAVVATRWSQILDLPAHPTGDGWCIALSDGALRFVTSRDGRGEGLRAVDLASTHRDAIIARARMAGVAIDDESMLFCGTVIRLVDAR